MLFWPQHYWFFCHSILHKPKEVFMFYKDVSILGSKVTCLVYTTCVLICVDWHTVIPGALGTWRLRADPELMQVPKSEHVQVSFTNWCNVCLQPTHIHLCTSNHVCITHPLYDHIIAVQVTDILLGHSNKPVTPCSAEETFRQMSSVCGWGGTGGHEEQIVRGGSATITCRCIDAVGHQFSPLYRRDPLTQLLMLWWPPTVKLLHHYLITAILLPLWIVVSITEMQNICIQPCEMGWDPQTKNHCSSTFPLLGSMLRTAAFPPTRSLLLASFRCGCLTLLLPET